MNLKEAICLHRHVRLSPYYERRVSQSTFEVSDQLAISMLSPPAHGILGSKGFVEVGFRIGLVNLRLVGRSESVFSIASASSRALIFEWERIRACA
jgi:hypothetical protein